MVKRWLNRYFARKQLLGENALTQRYLVIDLELTGLDPKQHEIVSIAWVLIDNQCIKLSQAQHAINKDVRHLEQSPVYHGIAQQDVATGQNLTAILAALSSHFADAILVFHNATLDWGFLKQAFQAKGVAAHPKLILDTFHIEKKRLHQQGHEIGLDDLTLSACRARYGLPHYGCHHALTDAMATAELLLAQCHQISRGQQLKLAALL
ncbi:MULTISPECIES: 3'-5' exonuclease [Pseudoalteromonas]|uniref:3'-5' exonuclease n=1 Tax=Pseudoalteromonas haloplanktis TaxID=228 RepID=A0ABU1BC92_PSEHA|nr:MULTISPECIES: 3'-5' exonuclease [Pseudoalteromonas]MCF6143983.1 DNA polymerase III subunit epsilon [Pseudoalteromonas mariniglutinosa NCIMB 1770]MDQ9091970.1 3'-5' exonuclease [Pseudoalteromonas haloplanktis]TMN71305.1 3'-5' exonuclease [Pseudoalteromonas sp. S1727]BDF93256.1 DNA polymerase III subunit epsilon [Pseudoalteromonas sp. KAN5]